MRCVLVGDRAPSSVRVIWCGVVLLLQVYSVCVRVDTEYVLGLLLEKGQFDIARKYASIVKSTASQVTIKEVGHVNMSAQLPPSFEQHMNY